MKADKIRNCFITNSQRAQLKRLLILVKPPNLSKVLVNILQLSDC